MKSASPPIPATHPTLGVVIRFKNSAATLPAVLAALRRQTVQPDLIVGVNNHSKDASPELLRTAGANLVDWTDPYSHPRVLNFALGHCPTDLVLVLSSHTVLESRDAIERLINAMADPRVACASGKWDDDRFFSDSLAWRELQTKGLKFCSIYSNSMGILRRSLWKELPFDETLPTMEDGAWALEQVRRGYLCRRLDFAFSYQRSGQTRDFIFAVVTFRLAARHGLPVAWLGVATTLRVLLRAAARRWIGRMTIDTEEAIRLRQRLLAWCSWRLIHSARN